MIRENRSVVYIVKRFEKMENSLVRVENRSLKSEKKLINGRVNFFIRFKNT